MVVNCAFSSTCPLALSVARPHAGEATDVPELGAERRMHGEQSGQLEDPYPVAEATAVQAGADRSTILAGYSVLYSVNVLEDGQGGFGTFGQYHLDNGHW